mmetsp:Transcript_30815/g.50974  ORF Transcript_30815/g.50974 Transcript_30815/m.50974 type:complete len:229 (-) Transcript_30815:433-1119(-)
MQGQLSQKEGSQILSNCRRYGLGFLQLRSPSMRRSLGLPSTSFVPQSSNPKTTRSCCNAVTTGALVVPRCCVPWGPWRLRGWSGSAVLAIQASSLRIPRVFCVSRQRLNPPLLPARCPHLFVSHCASCQAHLDELVSFLVPPLRCPAKICRLLICCSWVESTGKLTRASSVRIAPSPLSLMKTSALRRNFYKPYSTLFAAIQSFPVKRASPTLLTQRTILSASLGRSS